MLCSLEGRANTDVLTVWKLLMCMTFVMQTAARETVSSLIDGERMFLPSFQSQKRISLAPMEVSLEAKQQFPRGDVWHQVSVELFWICVDKHT